jgi:hypothetical protein
VTRVDIVEGMNRIFSPQKGNKRFLNVRTVIPILGVLTIVVAATGTTVPNLRAQTIPSTVTILGICGATPTPATLSYGSLAPNAISGEQTVNLANAGNAAAGVSVSGTDWTGGGNTVMKVDATRYSLSSGSYGSKVILLTSAASLTTIPATQNTNTFWQLQAALTNPTFSGAAAQAVTLTVTCQ